MALRKPTAFHATEGYIETMLPLDDLDLQGGLAKNSAAPVDPGDLVNKAYADAIVSGLDPKNAVNLATAAALPAFNAAGTGVGKTLTANANGALTVDGVAAQAGWRILVKDEGGGTSVHNGIYTVTATGDAGNPWVLTRATDADEDAEVTSGLYTLVSGGTQVGRGYTLTTNDPITVDTTPLSFTQFSAPGNNTFAQGLLDTAGAISVELDTGAVAQAAGNGGGSSGLEFDINSAAGKLRLAVNPTGGIERTATGAAVKLASDSLASSAAGLSVGHAPRNQSGAAASGAVAIGDPVFASSTAGQYTKAEAQSQGGNDYSLGEVDGISISVATNPGDPIQIVSNGPVQLPGAALTPGAMYYLGPTGGLVTPAPGNNNRLWFVGRATATDVLHVNLQEQGRR